MKRLEALQGFIDNTSSEHKKMLEHTLFKIEMTRLKSKSPLQAAMDSSKLMWDSFGKLKDSLEELQSELTQLPTHGNPIVELKLVSQAKRTHSASDQVRELNQKTQALHEKAMQDVAKVLKFNPRNK